MSVTPEELLRIAGLARIRPDPERAARLVEDLNRVLAHVEALRGADVSGVQEGDGLAAELPPFRDPEPEPDPLAPGGVEAMAPDWREGFFVVPRLPGVEGS
jgi:aspartyl/glutamyl-tRNA(Asn/Gln) amidotransferase C subunit